MKSSFELEKISDWHYDSHQKPNGELKKVSTISIQNIEKVVEKILAQPYELGGIKRVHSGDPAVAIDNPEISRRSLYMREIGYGEDDYFIEFNNDIADNFANEMKEKFNLSYNHCCIVVIPPGQCMPVHSDTYSYLMRYMKRDFPQIEYDLKKHCKRYLVFLTDWDWGHSLGAGNVIKWQWKKGDVYEWNHKLLHWSSNAGMEPIVFFEITGLKL